MELVSRQNSFSQKESLLEFLDDVHQ